MQIFDICPSVVFFKMFLTFHFQVELRVFYPPVTAPPEDWKVSYSSAPSSSSSSPLLALLGPAKNYEFPEKSPKGRVGSFLIPKKIEIFNIMYTMIVYTKSGNSSVPMPIQNCEIQLCSIHSLPSLN